jgi:hypothetical protein
VPERGCRLLTAGIARPNAFGGGRSAPELDVIGSCAVFGTISLRGGPLATSPRSTSFGLPTTRTFWPTFERRHGGGPRASVVTCSARRSTKSPLGKCCTSWIWKRMPCAAVELVDLPRTAGGWRGACSDESDVYGAPHPARSCALGRDGRFGVRR